MVQIETYSVQTYTQHGNSENAQSNRFLQCIMQENVNAVLTCLHQGTKITTKNDKGETALHLSISRGNEVLTSLLLRNGAYIIVNSMTYNGMTPLHYAALIGNNNIIKELISYGANINFRDEEGDTPLHYAVRERKENSLVYLLQLGADKNQKNDDGETPLHFACCFGELKMVEILIHFNAEVLIVDNSGSSPIDEAKNAKHNRIVDLLIKKAASLPSSNRSLY